MRRCVSKGRSSGVATLNSARSAARAGCRLTCRPAFRSWAGGERFPPISTTSFSRRQTEAAMSSCSKARTRSSRHWRPWPEQGKARPCRALPRTRLPNCRPWGRRRIRLFQHHRRRQCLKRRQLPPSRWRRGRLARASTAAMRGRAAKSLSATTPDWPRSTGRWRRNSTGPWQAVGRESGSCCGPPGTVSSAIATVARTTIVSPRPIAAASARSGTSCAAAGDRNDSIGPFVESRLRAGTLRLALDGGEKRR